MAKVRGSKDGKIVSARFEGQSKSLFPTLQQTKAVVLLSIKGNEFCTQDYLKAMIEKAISTHGFTTFLVADEIYWHNLSKDFSDREEAVLRKKAKELGDIYLEDNLKYFLMAIKQTPNEFNKEHAAKSLVQKINLINEISRKSYHFEIVNWNDWLDKSPSFCEKKESIMKLYQTEKLLANSIEKTAANFAKRHQSSEESFELLCRRSSGYLIEECPAIMWIAASLNYHFIVYPGEMIKPFRETKEFFVKGNNEPAQHNFQIYSESPHLLVNWLEVSFQRSHIKATSEYQNILSRLNFEKTSLNNHTLTETSEIVKGVTEGIFSLALDYETKINLLVDFLIQYKKQKNRVC